MKTTILNLTMTNANTEYSITLPQHRGLLLNPPIDAVVRMAFGPGHVGSSVRPFWTFSPGLPVQLGQQADGQLFADSVLYFASPTAGKVLELIYW